MSKTKIKFNPQGHWLMPTRKITVKEKYAQNFYVVKDHGAYLVIQEYKWWALLCGLLVLPFAVVIESAKLFFEGLNEIRSGKIARTDYLHGSTVVRVERELFEGNFNDR